MANLSSFLSRLTGRPLPRAKPFTEMGVSGTPVWGGYIQQREKSSDWIGQRRFITAAELAVNTSIVAAGLHYFLNLIAHPNWSVRPADDKNPEAVRLAEWVDEVIHDMGTPWYRVVRKAGMYRFHGFGLYEWTAKRLDDGSIGLLDIESRPQHTIERWEVDESGAITGVWQRSPQTSQLLGIPRNKLVYLVDDTLTDSPEGLGMFRHMAEPYNRLKRFYELEARGFERDLRGIPIGRAPISLINRSVEAGALTKEQATTLVASLQSMVEIQVKGSSTGLILDSQPHISQGASGDQLTGTPQWGFELLNGPGVSMAEIGAAIDRTQREMARIIGAEQLMMGDTGGNRALAADKSRNMYLIANSVLKHISTQTAADVIDALWMLNGYDDELKPTFETEDVTFKDVEQVSSTLARMAQAGAVLRPDDPVIDDVRELLGVSKQPQMGDDSALVSDVALEGDDSITDPPATAAESTAGNVKDPGVSKRKRKPKKVTKAASKKRPRRR